MERVGAAAWCGRAGRKRRGWDSVTLVAALCGMLALVLAGCGSNNKVNTANTAANGTPAPTPSTADTAGRTFSKAPAFTLDPTKGYQADIKTAHGDIIVTLNEKAAPLTVNNFIFLARQHFYDGLTCHRVIPGFVAQCGDPTGTGNGGPGYTIPDEPSPLTHVEGAIAMAKTNAPNSAGSQFYIVLAPQPQLDGKYTVFGQVTSGLDAAKQIAPRDPQTATAPGDTITSITITETSTPATIPAHTPTPAATGKP